jgi:hypothetical protein
MAIQREASKATPFIDGVYFNLFQDLIMTTAANHTTFTSIIFVRIVFEACRKLGINCARRISLADPSGPHLLCAEDVIKAFCRADNKTPHLKVKTFANHRGWYFRAEQLYETLSHVYPNLSQIPDALTDEKLFSKYCKDLLKTPLTNARDLSTKTYGQLKLFQNLLYRLEDKYGIARNEKSKRNKGRSSRRNEIELDDSEVEDGEYE